MDANKQPGALQYIKQFINKQPFAVYVTKGKKRTNKKPVLKLFRHSLNDVSHRNLKPQSKVSTGGEYRELPPSGEHRKHPPSGDSWKHPPSGEYRKPLTPPRGDHRKPPPSGQFNQQPFPPGDKRVYVPRRYRTRREDVHKAFQLSSLAVGGIIVL